MFTKLKWDYGVHSSRGDIKVSSHLKPPQKSKKFLRMDFHKESFSQLQMGSFESGASKMVKNNSKDALLMGLLPATPFLGTLLVLA